MEKCILFLIYLCNLNSLFCQELHLLNDSAKLKREIFEQVLNNAVEGKKKRIYCFREFVGTFSLSYRKDNSELKKRLGKYLPAKSVKEIYSLSKFDYPHTS